MLLSSDSIVTVERTFLVTDRRPSQSLIFSSKFPANLGEDNSVFWGTVGGSLRELELSFFTWSNEALFNVLRLCPKLEILKFGKMYPNTGTQLIRID